LFKRFIPKFVFKSIPSDHYHKLTMAQGVKQQERKNNYFGKVHTLCKANKKAFIVTVDNVTSSQLHQIRQSLRNEATVLMGKNTMVRKAIREVLEECPDYEVILPYIKGNIGLVFTNGDLKKIRSLIISNRVAAPAKVGAIAQCDVSIPSGNTGIQPDKTSFFQALNISTKVVKGAIEIMNETLLVKTGQKVGPSEAELLNMLGVMPFTYGLSVLQVYDEGSIYESSILDISEESLINSFMAGTKNVAALSLQIDFPTVASVPHSIVNGYKKVLGIALATEYSFPAADAVKKILANPAAFAVAPVAAAIAMKAVVAPVKVEEKEESDEDMGLDLFG